MTSTLLSTTNNDCSSGSRHAKHQGLKGLYQAEAHKFRHPVLEIQTLARWLVPLIKNAMNIDVRALGACVTISIRQLFIAQDERALVPESRFLLSTAMLMCGATHTAAGAMNSSLHCVIVSMTLVTVCPCVLGDSKISWSLPPLYVLSPKKWIVS